jgi:hypothetical protein
VARSTTKLVAILTAGVLCACSRPDGAGAAPADSAPGSASAVPEEPSGPPLSDLPTGDAPVSLARAKTLVAPGATRIELVSAGDEPRQPLKHPTTPQPPQSVELAIDVALNITLPGAGAVKQPVPPMRVVMALGVEASVETSGEAKATLTVALSDVSLAPRTESEEAIAREMQGVLGKLRGLHWTLAFDPHGPLGAAVAPKGAPVEVMQLWGTIDEALRDLVVPLPKAALGKGARWKVFDRVRRAGVELLRRSDYSLVSRDGELLTLRATVHESAISRSAMRDPALPKALIVRALAGRSEGKRELVRALGVIVPKRSESTVVSRVSTNTRHEKSAESGQRASLVLEQTLHIGAAQPTGQTATKGKD